MMRMLLVRGLLAGAAGGIAAFVFAFLFGEPAIENAIAFEGAAHAHHETAHTELVSRGVQSTVGLAVALLVYGLAIGGIFALVFAATYGRLGQLSAHATAAVLGVVGFVSVVLTPMLKYPAMPPAATADGDVGSRTVLYLLMIGVSVVAAIAATIASQGIVRRFGLWNGVVLAGVGYAVAMLVVGSVMPDLAPVTSDFPAATLYDFRVASLGVHLVLMATLALVFGGVVHSKHQEFRSRATTYNSLASSVPVRHK